MNLGENLQTLGKRSDFKRIEKDFYRTIDPNAVKALLPLLPLNSSYAEPCYGDGDLEDWLCKEGHNCLWRSDIQSSVTSCVIKDALELSGDDVVDCDFIITNPVWERKLLHKMIEHFSNLKPTWLLFDSDWCQTKQSSELVKKYLTDIVAVGRLKWIPDTKMSGKDNCSWYLFDKNKDKGTIFHGR